VSRWLHELPVVRIAAIVVTVVAAVVGALYLVTVRLAVGEAG
jgi:hypothetical protein